MLKNPRRVLSVICGICFLVPLLWYIALCIYTLFLPDIESKDYVFLFLFIGMLPVLIISAIRTKDLFLLKKPVPTGMALILLGILLFAFGNSMIGLDSNLLIKLPFLLIIAAGVLAIISSKKAPAGEGPASASNN